MSQAGLISSTGGGGGGAATLTFTDEAISFAGAVNNGYFCTGALTVTLPTTPSQGSYVIIETTTASAVVIQAGGTNVIKLGSTASAAGGTATSNAIGNSVFLIFRTSTTTWYSISTEGTWTIA